MTPIHLQKDAAKHTLHYHYREKSVRLLAYPSIYRLSMPAIYVLIIFCAVCKDWLCIIQMLIFLNIEIWLQAERLYYSNCSAPALYFVNTLFLIFWMVYKIWWPIAKKERINSVLSRTGTLRKSEKNGRICQSNMKKETNDRTRN